MMDRRKQAEAVLSRVAMAAGLAAKFHPGRFADGAIENVAFEIGVRLDGLSWPRVDVLLSRLSARQTETGRGSARGYMRDRARRVDASCTIGCG